MSAQIIDGKKIANRLRHELAQRVQQHPDKPGLAIILIGEDPGSQVYVRLKEQAARAMGMHFELHAFAADIDEQTVISLVHELNRRPEINGIVIQFPLPGGLNKDNIITAINPIKDVDGFHPNNIAALLAGKPLIVPGLAEGIMLLLAETHVGLSGKQAVIVAKSTIFSEPLGYLLEQEGAGVQSCNPAGASFEAMLAAADIVVVALGQPGLITGDMIMPGAIIIDVGYNRIGGKPVGDADFDSVKEQAGWITPVPGGVGPMTVVMLLLNVLYAYKLQNQ